MKARVNLADYLMVVEAYLGMRTIDGYAKGLAEYYYRVGIPAFTAALQIRQNMRIDSPSTDGLKK